MCVCVCVCVCVWGGGVIVIQILGPEGPEPKKILTSLIAANQMIRRVRQNDRGTDPGSVQGGVISVKNFMEKQKKNVCLTCGANSREFRGSGPWPAGPTLGSLPCGAVQTRDTVIGQIHGSHPRKPASCPSCGEEWDLGPLCEKVQLVTCRKSSSHNGGHPFREDREVGATPRPRNNGSCPPKQIFLAERFVFWMFISRELPSPSPTPTPILQDELNFGIFPPGKGRGRWLTTGCGKTTDATLVVQLLSTFSWLKPPPPPWARLWLHPWTPLLIPLQNFCLPPCPAPGLICPLHLQPVAMVTWFLDAPVAWVCLSIVTSHAGFLHSSGTQVSWPSSKEHRLEVT